MRAGEELELQIEKPAAGGRMIARHNGEVVLVAGAIPGERVRARVTRAERRVAFAQTSAVIEGSSDRRETSADPSCGGCLYAHISYRRQILLKADVIKDAFARIGRLPLEQDVKVEASPDSGYRMRARFHVRDRRVGFYREGTHELCDPRQTRQLGDAAIDAVEAAAASLAAQGIPARFVELSENIAADSRALHLDLQVDTPAGSLERVIAAAGLAGCTGRTDGGAFYSAGDPIVSDPLNILAPGIPSTGWLRRHPESFFQSNRFLLPALVTAVLDAVSGDTVLDLYAGVGLFSVTLAASGRSGITAVEGDAVSGRDLLRNAAPYYDQLRVSRDSVEAYLAARPPAPHTVIVDPPRTGLSAGAAQAMARLGARHIVYVSCDPPTMARDARKLLDAGYRLVSIEGFDLFPNTPHVETLGVFEVR